MAAEIDDVAVRLEGDWPDSTLELTFRHDRWPGLRLRRRYELFDECGRPRHEDDIEDDLIEDIASGWVPPDPWANDGILDF